LYRILVIQIDGQTERTTGETFARYERIIERRFAIRRHNAIVNGRRVLKLPKKTTIKVCTMQINKNKMVTYILNVKRVIHWIPETIRYLEDKPLENKKYEFT
jgi:hypothetical protein